MESQNNAAYKRWAGAEWWEEGYERLWDAKQQGGLDSEGAGAAVDGTEETAPDGEEPKRRPRKREPSRAERETVVYLTADSEEELTELKEGESYIIGGIVDHNRYKVSMILVYMSGQRVMYSYMESNDPRQQNLCLNKSKEHNVRSARLPIGTYLAEMRTRKVLTVNQTFEILLKWVETRDWEQAIYAVMPKRKFNAEGRRRGGGAASSKGGESADEEEGGGDGDGGSEGAHAGEDDAHVVDLAALEEDQLQEVEQSSTHVSAVAMET